MQRVWPQLEGQVGQAQEPIPVRSGVQPQAHSWDVLSHMGD